MNKALEGYLKISMMQINAIELSDGSLHKNKKEAELYAIRRYHEEREKTIGDIFDKFIRKQNNHDYHYNDSENKKLFIKNFETLLEEMNKFSKQFPPTGPICVD